MEGPQGEGGGGGGEGSIFAFGCSTLGAGHRMDVGGCQNYGPFFDPYYNTAPNI